MKKFPVVPILAAALFAAACGDDPDGGPVDPPTDPRPSVRFFNAMTGMTVSGGFTTNGQFVTGSALTFSQATDPCAKLEAGLTSFAFGPANSGGTALNGNALATLPNQNLTTGGNFTVAAIGHGVHSIMFMLNNSFTGTLGSNQAAVRFVNLSAIPNAFTVMMGTTTHATNLEQGTASAYASVPSGNTAFTIQAPPLGPPGQPLTTVLSGNAATLNLQAGTVNTVAIVHTGPTGSGYTLITLRPCS